MRLLFLLFIFISSWTYGASQTCLSIIDSENTIEDKLKQITNLKDSWDCVEYFYQENNHYKPTLGNDSDPKYILGSIREYGHQDIITRISDIALFYTSPLDKNKVLSPPIFLHGPQKFLVLGKTYSYSLTFFSQKIPSVFNGFPLDMKNLFEFFAIRNRILLNPYINLHTNTSMLLRSHSAYNLDNTPENLNLYTTDTLLSMPPAAVCQNNNNEHNTELLRYFQSLTINITNFITQNSQALRLYLSALNFYYLSHGKSPTFFLGTQSILHSLPYGFEFSKSTEQILQGLSDNQQNLLENVNRLISLLKLYTFTEIMLLAFFDCSPYVIHENLTISQTDKIPSKKQKVNLWKSDEDISNSDWNKYVKLSYEVTEVFVFDRNFNPPKKHIAYDTLLFPEGFLTENDFMEDLCSDCFQNFENLYKTVIGVPQP